MELNKTARSKSESFQRLAAIIELDRVYTVWQSLEEPDWSKVTSGQPVYIDASSNGYQHVSCLLRNRDLAEKVNVIPNSGGTPADLYDLVAKKAKKVRLELVDDKWEQSDAGEPAEKIMRNILSKLPKWSSKDLDRAIKAIFSRSTAKKPTMTRVYGAKDILKSIWGSGGEGPPSWCKQLKDPLTPEEEEARKAVPADAKAAYESRTNVPRLITGPLQTLPNQSQRMARYHGKSTVFGGILWMSTDIFPYGLADHPYTMA